MQAELSDYEGSKPRKRSTKIWSTKAVGQMKPGEFGWAVPWIVEVDTDRKMWIKKDWEVNPSAGGNVQMMVRRTKNGVEIRPPAGCKFTVSEQPTPRNNLLPVDRLV